MGSESSARVNPRSTEQVGRVKGCFWPLAVATHALTTSSAMGCDFNRSMQHLVSKSREEDVADEEVPKEDSLHRSRQEHDVGPLPAKVSRPAAWCFSRFVPKTYYPDTKPSPVLRPLSFMVAANRITLPLKQILVQASIN